MKREFLALAFTCLMFSFFSLSTQAQVSFFQPPTYAGSGTVFVADFNGDGKPDILTSDGTMNLGNGDGTFTLGTPVSVSSGQVLAVADFNGDGKPDVLEQGTGTLLVLLGNGDGTFQTPVSTSSGASLSVVAAADLNGDGSADVMGVFVNSLVVYISKGDGTFAAGVSYNLGVTPAGVPSLSLGDFNGDSKIDAVVSTNGSEEVVFLGNGDGTFQATTKTSAGIFSVLGNANAAPGDFNGDGKLDLAVSGCNTENCSDYTVYLFVGNGDGTFQAPVAALPAFGSLVSMDVNEDGKVDLIVAGSAATQVYLGNGDGTFINSANYLPSFGAGSSYTFSGVIAVADFNADGELDVAASNAVLWGNGDGTFRGVGFAPVDGSVSAAVVGDFESTGTPDVAVVSSQSDSSNSVYILHNSGGVLSLSHTYALQQPGFGIATADFNGDGKLDLMVIGEDQGTAWSYSVLMGNGDGSFQAPTFNPQSVSTNADSFSIVIADFNGDKKLDVAVNSGNNSLALLLGNGDGTFAAPSYVFDDGAPILLTGDFNSDGKLDIAASVAGGPTGILFGNGDGTFQAETFPTNLSSYPAQFTSDVNNDGNADMVSYSGQVALGNGDGTFTVLPSPGDYVASAVADVNGDGKPDELVTIYEIGSVHPQGTGILMGNGDGTFGPVVSLPLLPIYGGTTPTLALIADMNGDGRPDILFSPSLSFPGTGIAVMMNTTPPGFGVVASALSPAPVTAGNAATSTITVSPTFGFSGTVALSCTGLPSGATCAFNPPSIASGAGTSALTVTTSASVAAGTYPLQVQGTVGSIVNSVPASLVVQAAPGFSLGATSGSSTSQTVSAGQTASFNLALAPAGGFTGPVNFTCAITPTATPAPTCSVPSSVLITGSGTQTVAVTVGTTAPVTTGALPPVNFPTGPSPLIWTLATLASGWLLVRNRRRLPIAAASAMVLALAFSLGCGGSGSSSSHTTPGTPSGTYTATITATSGSVSQNMALMVVVQ